ncbi:hypothetical protein LguiB_010502 [Lonicera macranthoides]
MTVEEIRGNLRDATDNFPVGMRVLAVDDDPTCLKLLDFLLRKCQYQVTTTSQSRTALKMLRENRNRFDLIISDVYMPDMDGFKLLELVGLEMDLPVIMLSANSDPKLVMKGITHGACDYLVKPVRLEELRNIWQHVIRRKKFDPKSQNNPTAQEESESGEGPLGNNDQNGKVSRKRKDEEEDGDDNGHENEDSGTQKRPRVVWSIELHRKFVAAVNQLGIDKAFPKRILDMMNVEGLTRENVASHLQKYRLYLKRISSVASHQANMVTVLGAKDTSYFRMGSLDGLGDFRTFSSSAQISNTALSSYQPSGILGRLNSPAGLNLCHQNSSNSINALGKFQPVVSPACHNASLFQGLRPVNQLQQSTSTAAIGEFNSIDDQRLFMAGSTFTDTKVTVGSCGNSLAAAPSSNPLVPQGNHQSSLEVASLNSESFSVGGSSVLMNSSRCNENWKNTIQLSKFPSNTLPLSEPFNQDHFSCYNNSSTHHIQNNPIDFSSNTTISAPVQDSESREGLFGDIVQNVNQTQNQRRGIQEHDYTHNSNNSFGALSQSLNQNNAFYNRRMGISLVGQLNTGALNPLQHAMVEKSTVGFDLEQTKSVGGMVHHGYDSLDDLMHAMMKREQDGTVLMGGEFGFDPYAFGSCI